MDNIKYIDKDTGLIFDKECPICDNEETLSLSEILSNFDMSDIKSKLFISKTNNKVKNNIYDKFIESGKKHIHYNKICSGHWKCSRNHKGIYDKHILCNVKGCPYSEWIIIHYKN